MAGPRGVVQAGAVVDVEAAEGEALVAGGYADALERAVPVETASREPDEVAVTRRRRGR